jgi:putative phosphoribosyl transferase
MHHQPFKDRRDAGQQLAKALLPLKSEAPIVLGLPRGGVPVAYEVAQSLEAPLSLFIVRKLGVPGHRELAMGALASGGALVLDEALVRQLPVSPQAVAAVIGEETRELARRERAYTDGQPLPLLSGRTVILVDDGLATGMTMRAAVQAVRKHRPARVIVAVPVGAADSIAALEREADAVVCISRPEPFMAVGLWYASFPQTTDQEVRDLLARADGRERVPG